MRILLLILCILPFSCNKEEPNQVLFELPYLFENGFEVSELDLDLLILPDTSSWTNIQQVDPNNGTNSIAISDELVSEGKNSLKIISMPSDEVLSKINIEKFGFEAKPGNTIRIEADFYINSDVDLSDLFLIDLECCSCWDPNVPNNQCPGVRLKIGGDDEYLSIERGKITSPTITQAEFSFPKFEWVNLIWEMELSQETNGMNNLTINGNEVISTNGINMPNAARFEEEFASYGIDFNLPENIFYERVQIGATANPTQHKVELYIDNFSISIR